MICSLPRCASSSHPRQISRSKANLGFPQWENLFHRGGRKAITRGKDEVCPWLGRSILQGGTVVEFPGTTLECSRKQC